MQIHALKAFAVLLACITVGSNFGKLHFVLDTLSHFKVQYAVLFLISAGFFGFLKNQTWLVLSLVGFIANLVAIVPWYVAENEWLPADSDKSIKVLIFNVYLRNQNY